MTCCINSCRPRGTKRATNKPPTVESAAGFHALAYVQLARPYDSRPGRPRVMKRLAGFPLGWLTDAERLDTTLSINNRLRGPRGIKCGTEDGEESQLSRAGGEPAGSPRSLQTADSSSHAVAACARHFRAACILPRLSPVATATTKDEDPAVVQRASVAALRHRARPPHCRPTHAERGTSPKAGHRTPVAMFKFKMLTKVLVAVFFYGQIIELNLNLCIAHSIGLANPERQSGSPHAAWQLRDPLASSDDFQSMAPDDRQRVMLAPPFASRTLLESASEEISEARGRGAGSSTSTLTKTTQDDDGDETPAQNQAVPQQERRELRVSPTEERERELIEAATSGPNDAKSKANEIPKETSDGTKDLAQEELEQALEGPKQILESNGRLNYFGRVFVGESRTPFMVLFDLASTGLWLPSSECKSDECISRTKFNASASQSYRALEPSQPFNLTLDTKMKLLGHWGRDVVEFAGIPIEGQHFGEISEIHDGDLMTYLPVDGFLGLGFKRQLASPQDGHEETPLTPFGRLWASGRLREPIFSLLLRADIEEF
ncbi:pepsin A-like, partial [Olea europaea subsp. europaea]